MIKTKRLILRPLEIKDADDLYLYFNDEDINKYLYKQRNSSLKEIKNYILQINNHCLGIQYKDKIIGDISIIINNDYGEIAWVINKECQNKGLAYEASKEYINYIFNNYPVNVIKAHCDINNIASKCLIKKLGFNYITTIPRIYIDGRLASLEEEYELKKQN